VHQLLALDRPPIDSLTRRALARAFDESTLYDETAVSVRWTPPRDRSSRHARARAAARTSTHTSTRAATRTPVGFVRFLDPLVR
jgi:hypothetical protein